MTADQLFSVCVVGLIVLACGLLLALMRCTTLLARERERTDAMRVWGGRWQDYAAGLEQWIAATDPSLDEHFAQTPAAPSYGRTILLDDTQPMTTVNGHGFHTGDVT